jgi:hypothetical protein
MSGRRWRRNSSSVTLPAAPGERRFDCSMEAQRTRRQNGFAIGSDQAFDTVDGGKRVLSARRDETDTFPKKCQVHARARTPHRFFASRIASRSGTTRAINFSGVNRSTLDGLCECRPHHDRRPRRRARRTRACSVPRQRTAGAPYATSCSPCLLLRSCRRRRDARKRHAGRRQQPGRRSNRPRVRSNTHRSVPVYSR